MPWRIPPTSRGKTTRRVDGAHGSERRTSSTAPANSAQTRCLRETRVSFSPFGVQGPRLIFPAVDLSSTVSSQVISSTHGRHKKVDVRLESLRGCPSASSTDNHRGPKRCSPRTREGGHAAPQTDATPRNFSAGDHGKRSHPPRRKAQSVSVLRRRASIRKTQRSLPFTTSARLAHRAARHGTTFMTRRMSKMTQTQRSEMKVWKAFKLAAPMPVPVHGQTWSKPSTTKPRSSS
mmetsp:Transcript_22795/g.90408  ORF Transcript_22795/g.90408 Transcript_22795/m.90408 type:complete len:234 (-) Transcript_22795:345-1046(-)